MNEEEKKAIERINKTYDDNTGYYEAKGKDWIIINKLIIKLQKENKEKDKQIDLMAEYMEENMDEYQLDEIYAKQYNCNGMKRNWTRGKEKEVTDIKQYFEKLAKEKGK